MYSLSSAAVTCSIAWSIAGGRTFAAGGAATEPTNHKTSTVTKRDNIVDLKV